MFYCYCRCCCCCCWTPPTNFSERRIAMRSAQRVGHHDQFLEKKQKTKTATIEAIIISFFRVLFSIIYGLLYISQLCGLSVRLSVYGGVCVWVRVWEVVVHDVTAKKLACKTSWPFVSVANNNRANHLNDITRKWNVNNSLCHAMRETNWQRDTL